MINCTHQCTSNCRREGCNCECGEFHEDVGAYVVEEVLKAQKELTTEKSQATLDEVISYLKSKHF